jgi:anti-sigma factor RsiW
MMNCEQIEVWISAYQDGELDPGRQRRVEAHLATCGSCRELMAEWSALECSLRAELIRDDAPETLHTRVMRQIPDERPAAAPLGRRGSWTPGGWFTFGLAPIGALTAWMLWTGHGVSPQGRTPVEPTPGVVSSPAGSRGSQVATMPQPAPGIAPKVDPKKTAPLPKQIGPNLP